MSYGNKKAAFKVGQKVKYIGDSQWSSIVNGKETPTRFRGMIVEIIEIKPPEKGLGFVKIDDDGEPLIDHDHNGCNVALNEFGHRFLIWPENKNQWELIKQLQP